MDGCLWKKKLLCQEVRDRGRQQQQVTSVASDVLYCILIYMYCIMASPANRLQHTIHEQSPSLVTLAAPCTGWYIMTHCNTTVHAA
jgi:hypothetical protein